MMFTWSETDAFDVQSLEQKHHVTSPQDPEHKIPHHKNCLLPPSRQRIRMVAAKSTYCVMAVTPAEA